MLKNINKMVHIIVGFVHKKYYLKMLLQLLLSMKFAFIRWLLNFFCLNWVMTICSFIRSTTPGFANDRNQFLKENIKAAWFYETLILITLSEQANDLIVKNVKIRNQNMWTLERISLLVFELCSCKRTTGTQKRKRG